jgi:branched-chain amino acid transport system ATP-binding protein
MTSASPGLAAARPAPLLEMRDVEVTYQGVIVGVRGISLELHDAETAVILGANGAGKSTTLTAIAGFSPVDRASISRGSVWFEGRRISGNRQDVIARGGISFIPERDKIFRGLTVEENLRCVVTRKGVSRDDMLAFIYELFPVLRDRREQVAGLLSGGQVQMLAIARGLVAGPKLLLPDEVSLGIAPALAETIIEALQRINRETGVTILMVEQNAGLALEIASKAYVLATGRMVFAGSTSELRSTSLLADFYVGSAQP